MSGDQSCDCKHDAPDRKHWDPACPDCSSNSVYFDLVCDDNMGICNHQRGFRCTNKYICGRPLWPKDGHGWCPMVKEIKSSIVDVNQCIRTGCKNKRTSDKYYCSHGCAKTDGASYGN